MKLGIIGLPNAGKTTIFNALTGQELEATPYPNPLGTGHHVGVVHVPDQRLDRLTEMYKPRKTTPADVTCVDITGFSRGISASKQKAGVFNEAWDVDAIIHVVRAFADPSVVHSEGGVDPAADAAALELELVFSDLELVETRLERIAASMKKGIGEGLGAEQAVLEKCRAQLEEEKPLRNLALTDKERAAIGSLQFVSVKPELVVLNVGEEEIDAPATESAVASLGDFYQGKDALVFSLSGKIETELSQLEPEEAALFLEDLGIAEPAMNRVIREAYSLLGLISFLTAGEDEVKAWTIRRRTPAVKAAGKIHSDIERGFIRAEVVAYDDLMSAGSMAKARDAGKVRLEGKDYAVQDGDIINFRFNV
ncbi:MAG: redox-regulated ATPase YchF [Actinobacteria bacterium]|nr:redox-regulated ATPase YchF [Actinomycetota bacterium]